MPERKLPRRRSAVRRLLRNPLSVVGVLVISIWVVVAIAAPWLTPHDPYRVNVQQRLLAPSIEHPLGTDMYGRDVLSRIMHGAKYDLAMAVLAVALAAGVGVPLGVFAAYRGGLTGEIIMRGADILMSFPVLVLAMALAAVLGPGLDRAIFAIAVVGIAGYVRLARGSALVVREECYVEAALATGAGGVRVMVKHILPNILAPVLVRGTLGMGNTVLLGASLSFIGLGVRPPTPEWGALITEGRMQLVVGKWWVSTFPGLAIMSLVLGFNLVGDALRDVFDPRGSR